MISLLQSTEEGKTPQVSLKIQKKPPNLLMFLAYLHIIPLEAAKSK